MNQFKIFDVEGVSIIVIKDYVLAPHNDGQPVIRVRLAEEGAAVSSTANWHEIEEGGDFNINVNEASELYRTSFGDLKLVPNLTKETIHDKNQYADMLRELREIYFGLKIHSMDAVAASERETEQLVVSALNNILTKMVNL